MIKFYAYYSFGGYRELYLGNTDSEARFSWYFPMIPVWEARLKDKENEKDRSMLEAALALTPHIEDVGRGGENAIPREAYNMVSYGGFDMMYRKAGLGQVLAVKDIASMDDTGRPAPFMLLFVSTDEDGAVLLDKLSESLLSNMRSFKEKMSGLFVYDLQKNGLRFDLETMNRLLNEVNNAQTALRLQWHMHFPIHILVTSQELNVALQNQKIKAEEVQYAVNLKGKVLIDKTTGTQGGEDGPKSDGDKDEAGDGSNGQADSGDGEHRSVVRVDDKKKFCVFWAKVKSFWKGLPKRAKYCAYALVAVLLILILACRSCNKTHSKTSQLALYEKTI